MMIRTISSRPPFSVLRRTLSLPITSVFYHATPNTALAKNKPQRRDASTSNTSTAIPVGIFLDMDNIVPAGITFRRQEGAFLIRPLRTFAEQMIQNIEKEGQLDSDSDSHTDGDPSHGGGDDHRTFVTTIQAFANRNTQTWMPPKLSNEDLMDQAYIGQESHVEEMDFPGAVVQTGYDKDEVLRCGICGHRIRLNKKDRARGLTEATKLDLHMKNLHDREQKKRQTRVKSMKSATKKKHLWQGRMGEQIKMYRAAQVGLGRNHSGINTQSGRPKENDIFQVLREEGVTIRSSDDVDTQLIRTATAWMNQQAKKHYAVRGIVVVVSEDSDFCDLLNYAQEKGFCAVSATPRSEMQTKALQLVSDVVIQANDRTDRKAGLRAEPNSMLARDLMLGLPYPLVLTVKD